MRIPVWSNASCKRRGRGCPAFVPEAELVETCLYDNTADEDFLIERRGRVVIGAGTSGHGFKFGPLLGEMLAALVEETRLRSTSPGSRCGVSPRGGAGS